MVVWYMQYKSSFLLTGGMRIFCSMFSTYWDFHSFMVKNYGDEYTNWCLTSNKPRLIDVFYRFDLIPTN